MGRNPSFIPLYNMITLKPVAVIHDIFTILFKNLNRYCEIAPKALDKSPKCLPVSGEVIKLSCC